MNRSGPGIYIHIPFCRSKCRYCDFTSYPEKLGFADAYMACLYREIKFRSKELKKYTFSSVYVGGGTPSVIDSKYIAGCLRLLRQEYDLVADAEITVEMNPESVTGEKVAAYKRAGVNRFSIGMQTASDRLLEDLGRAHTVADFKHACKMLNGENFNADLMIGLRGQTEMDVREAVKLAVDSGASHISVYALTPEDGTPVYGDYLNGDLPDDDETAGFYEICLRMLGESGFGRYEVSNFARDGKYSRHNLNYWMRGEYIGFGTAASSFMAGRRFTNTRDLDDYMKCILSSHYPVVDDELITEEDAKFEKVMLALRTTAGLDTVSYAEEFGTSFFTDFSAAVLKNKAYLERKGDFIRIKDEYLYVQNKILVDFLE